MMHTAARTLRATLYAAGLLGVGACGGATEEAGGNSAGHGTTTAGAAVCSGLATLAGDVREDALGDTAGQAVPNVAIGSSPSIATVTVTDAKGHFEATVPCSSTPYEITATKVGFEPRTVAALPNQASVSVAFNLVRSIDYQFVTLTVVDYSTQQTVGDVAVSIVGAGAEGTFFTGPDGTRSFPFPRAVTQRVAFAAPGYHTYIVDYWPTRDQWAPVDGLGRAVASPAGFTVRLVASDIAQLPAECKNGETSCALEDGGDRILECVAGTWAQSGRCPPDFPYCSLGVCQPHA
jgi:hypothetical protein